MGKGYDFIGKKRRKAGRKPSSTYGIIDSQSAKTASAADDRGIDGGKEIKGRKHHIVVDTMGNLLSIRVHAANIHDTKSGINTARKAYEKYPKIKKLCSDNGYLKSFEIAGLKELGLDVDISKNINLNLRFCQRDGLLSALLRELIILEDFPRTLKLILLMKRMF